jgi:hypothetical protein
VVILTAEKPFSQQPRRLERQLEQVLFDFLQAQFTQRPLQYCTCSKPFLYAVSAEAKNPSSDYRDISTILFDQQARWIQNCSRYSPLA